MKNIKKLKSYDRFVIVSLIIALIMIAMIIFGNIKREKDKEIIETVVIEKEGLTVDKLDLQAIPNNSKYGTHYLNLGGTYSREHEISKYKKIKINEKIDGLRIFITIDFPNRFKEGYSDYTTSNGFKFALKYFLGENGFDEEGGFYNVLRNKTCSNLINDSTRNLNGAIVGKEINGGYTRTLDLTNKTVIALEKDKCKPGLQYTYTDTLGFINKNLGKELYVGGYLSHVGEGTNHGPIKGREVSLIKEIKIEYIGNNGAIEIMN